MANLSGTPGSKPKYPLELVAKVAATFLTGRLNNDRPPDQYLTAANEAVKLLEACKTRLENDGYFALVQADIAGKEAERKAKAFKLNFERDELEKKYPTGMPWKKGLLYITRKKSETDAFAPFKRWRAYDIARWRLSQITFGPMDKIEPDTMDEDDALKEIEGFKSSGFSAIQAFNFRAEFSGWYQENIGRKKTEEE